MPIPKTKLNDHYDILYVGNNNRVAHEMILDCRTFKKTWYRGRRYCQTLN